MLRLYAPINVKYGSQGTLWYSVGYTRGDEDYWDKVAYQYKYKPKKKKKNGIYINLVVVNFFILQEKMNHIFIHRYGGNLIVRELKMQS